MVTLGVTPKRGYSVRSIMNLLGNDLKPPNYLALTTSKLVFPIVFYCLIHIDQILPNLTFLMLFMRLFQF